MVGVVKDKEIGRFSVEKLIRPWESKYSPCQTPLIPAEPSPTDKLPVAHSFHYQTRIHSFSSLVSEKSHDNFITKIDVAATCGAPNHAPWCSRAASPVLGQQPSAIPYVSLPCNNQKHPGARPHRLTRTLCSGTTTSGPGPRSSVHPSSCGSPLRYHTGIPRLDRHTTVCPESYNNGLRSSFVPSL